MIYQNDTLFSVSIGVVAVNRFTEALQLIYKQLRLDDGEPARHQRPPQEFLLFQDCSTAQLLDPAFAGEMVKFAYLEVGAPHPEP